MSDTKVHAHEREQWGSRAGFIFASVGAAVGFGNVWRFPALAYDYGGGAFFIPYLMALFIVGIPLLILEIAMGQYYRTGDIGCFGGIHARLHGIGVSSLVCGYSVVLYYIPLIAWTVRFFFESFRDFDLNFKAEGADPYMYFLMDIIGMKTLGDTLRPTRVVWPNFGCLAFVYFLLFLCVAFGVKNTGRIAYFTMGFPILLLFIFLILAASLEGSAMGVKEYIGIWDVSDLRTRGEVWSTAVSQIFFSIGVTFGIFTAYGSSCPKNAPVVANSFLIALSNSFFSFIAGFAVFSILGHLALRDGKTVAEVATAGPGLVFGVYPAVLATLKNGQHWVRIFLVFLFLLGIDSGFGLFEAVLIVLHDSSLGKRFSKQTLAAAFMGFGLLIGLLFITDAGLIFLDAVDYYVNFILILVGFFEVYGAGWIFGIEDQVEKIGTAPVVSHMFTTFGAFIFASGFWYGLEKNAVWAGFVALICFLLVGHVAVYYFCNKAAKERDMSLKDVVYTLTMENVVALKDRLSTHINPLPTIWALMIKYILPPILLMCFINLCAAKKNGKSIFGNYENYVDAPYQIIGILIVVLTMVIFTGGLLFPDLYSKLVRDEIRDAVTELNEKKVGEEAPAEEPVIETA